MAGAFAACERVIGGLVPATVFGIGVGLVEVSVDGSLSLLEIGEDAMLKLTFGKEREPGFDHVEPRCADRHKPTVRASAVEMPARPATRNNGAGPHIEASEQVGRAVAPMATRDALGPPPDAWPYWMRSDPSSKAFRKLSATVGERLNSQYTTSSRPMPCGSLQDDQIARI